MLSYLEIIIPFLGSVILFLRYYKSGKKLPMLIAIGLLVLSLIRIGDRQGENENLLSGNNVDSEYKKKNFSSYNFSVVVPELIDKHSLKGDTPFGNSTVNVFFFQDTKENFFSITVYNYKKEKLINKTIELNEFVELTAIGLNGIIVETSEDELNGKEGLKYLLENEHGVFDGWILHQDSKVYDLKALYIDNSIKNNNKNDFFSSFKIIE